jgi:hypothetical protein
MTDFYDPGVIRDRDGRDPWAEYSHDEDRTPEDQAAFEEAFERQQREIDEAHKAGLY